MLTHFVIRRLAFVLCLTAVLLVATAGKTAEPFSFVIDRFDGDSSEWPYSTVAVSPDHKTVAVGLIATKETVIYDVEKRKRREYVTIRSFFPGPLIFSEDSKALAAADAVRVFIFDVRTGLLIRSLPTGAHSLSFASDGKSILVTNDKGVSLWSIEDGSVLHTWERPSTNSCLSPDGKLVGINTTRMTSAGRRGVIELYDFRTHELRTSLEPTGAGRDVFRFSADSRRIIARDNKRIQVWTIDSPDSPKEVQLSERVGDFSISHNGKWIAANSGNLLFVNIETERMVPRDVLKGFVLTSCFSQDDSYFTYIDSKGIVHGISVP